MYYSLGTAKAECRALWKLLSTDASLYKGVDLSDPGAAYLIKEKAMTKLNMDCIRYSEFYFCPFCLYAKTKYKGCQLCPIFKEIGGSCLATVYTHFEDAPSISIAKEFYKDVILKVT
jgi:hypothetical protein